MENNIGNAWTESTCPQNVEFDKEAGLKKYTKEEITAILVLAIGLSTTKISMEIPRSERFAGSLNRICTESHGIAVCNSLSIHRI
jgi:hypothetical protein